MYIFIIILLCRLRSRTIEVGNQMDIKVMFRLHTEPEVFKKKVEHFLHLKRGNFCLPFLTNAKHRTENEASKKTRWF